MPKAKIRKDDEIVVLGGKDKGRRGKVLKIVAGGKRAVVEGINVCKKHLRPNPNKNIQGGIVERELSIHISNIALYNPAKKKADRVGFKFLEDGRKVRCFKSNGEVVDV